MLERIGASSTSIGLSSAPAAPADRRRVSPMLLADRMAIIDFAIVVVSALIAKVAYIDGFLSLPQPTLPYAGIALVLGFILHVFHRELDLYEPSAMGDSSIAVGKILGGLILSFLVLLGVLYLLKAVEFFSRGWMVLWLALSSFMLCTGRSMMRHFVQQMIAKGRLRERVAIFGAGSLGQQLRGKLEASCPEIELAGVYDDQSGSSEAITLPALNGGVESLIADARNGAIDRIIVALPATEGDRIRGVIQRLAPSALNLQFYTDVAPWPVPILGSCKRGDLQFYTVMTAPRSEHAQVIKSSIDYALAAFALIVLMPAFTVIAMIIKATSAGPVFFRQRRYGQHQKVFRIYKFRTMTVMEDGPVIKQADRNDCRVTRVGRLLRRTSLDELPQLINVLKGEMSIVGPRPHALVHDEYYALLINRYVWRHRVKPGITGWAQVNGLRGETKTREEMHRRMEHDLYYIENWSIWLDMEIILRTFFALLTRRGAY